jgi:uncharacterized protein HemX
MINSRTSEGNSISQPAPKQPETRAKKIVTRNVAVALGIICIILVAGIGAAMAYYTLAINNKQSELTSANKTINQLNTTILKQDDAINQLNATVTNLLNQTASDNATINSLTSSLTDLQQELNSILNESSSIGDLVMSDPSAWVNRTVVVEGVFGLSPDAMLLFIKSPWLFEVSSGNQTIGVSLNQSQYNWFMDT